MGKQRMLRTKRRHRGVDERTSGLRLFSESSRFEVTNNMLKSDWYVLLFCENACLEFGTSSMQASKITQHPRVVRSEYCEAITHQRVFHAFVLECRGNHDHATLIEF